MSQIITSIKQANDWLASVGEKRHVFKSLKSAQVTVAQTEARTAAKTVTSPNTVAPKAVVTVGELKAAISAEKNPGARIDMLESLRSHLVTAISANKADMVRGTELRRELQRIEKQAAYERMAEATESPAAAKARRIREFANE